MEQEEFEKWSKYIYQLLGCDYWENLSSNAECYLEKAKKNNNTALKNDFLQDIAELDYSVCYIYWSKQPLAECSKKWLELDNENKTLEYNPIENAMLEVVWHKLYPNVPYNMNKYHPVKFYCIFGIVPELDKFEQIDGAEIGGWMNVWDNPQILLDKYKSLIVGVIHPSRQETLKTLEDDKTATQMTLF